VIRRIRHGRVEQLFDVAHFEVRAISVDIGRHHRRRQRSVRGEKEQFFAVAAPPRLESATRGHQPSAIRLRKRRDEQLCVLAGRFVTECDPSSVRRERGPVFLRPRRQKLVRLAVAAERQHPDIVAGLFGVGHHQQVLTIRRPAHRPLSSLLVNGEEGFFRVDRDIPAIQIEPARAL
jgi:hypothetical protein